MRRISSQGATCKYTTTRKMLSLAHLTAPLRTATWRSFGAATRIPGVLRAHSTVSGPSRPTSALDPSMWASVGRIMSNLEQHNKPEEIWKSRSASRRREIAPPPGTYSGRSVPVFRNDVGGAYNKLQGLLARNQVRKELRLTERHEKRSDMKRRLKSERHRKRFAEFVSTSASTHM